MKVIDVYNLIDAFAPFAAQADFDHSGLQVGDFDATVTGVLVAVDLTGAVIDEAAACGCNLIVTHHPAIWQPLAALTEDDYTARLIMRLVRLGMHYIAAHTPVDNAAGGNSERLVTLLGGRVTGRLDCDPYAVTFDMPSISMSALLNRVRTTLSDDAAYMVGRDDEIVRGALCTGAGGDEQTIRTCVQKGLVYLTAEVKHHLLRYVEDNGGHLIVFGHFTSEQIFVTIIQELLMGAPVPVVASQQNNPCTVKV